MVYTSSFTNFLLNRIPSGFLPTTVIPTVIATSVEFHTAVIALGVCVLVFILICVTGCVCHRMKNITNAIKPSDFESNGIVLADQQAPRVANNYKVKDSQRRIMFSQQPQ